MLPLVINLDRSPDRWEYMKNQFNSLGISAIRVSAIDAKSRDYSGYATPLGNPRKYFFPRELSSGEICCFLSHKKCWERLLESEENWAAIFEDDVRLSNRVKEFGFSSEWIPDVIHIVQLHTCKPNCLCRTLPSAISLSGNNALFHVIDHSFGTCAYVIDREAAKYALNLSDKLDSPVDEFLFNFKSPFTRYFPTWRLNPTCVLHNDSFVSCVERKQPSREARYSLLNHLSPKRLFLSTKKNFLQRFCCKDTVFTWE